MLGRLPGISLEPFATDMCMRLCSKRRLRNPTYLRLSLPVTSDNLLSAGLLAFRNDPGLGDQLRKLAQHVETNFWGADWLLPDACMYRFPS
jgi:hypothetical protein